MAEDQPTRTPGKRGQPDQPGGTGSTPLPQSAGRDAGAATSSRDDGAVQTDELQGQPGQPGSFLRSLAGKWQLPLLVLGLLLLLTALPRLVNRKPPDHLDADIGVARETLRAGRFADTIQLVEGLLAHKPSPALDRSQQSQVVLIRGLANHGLASGVHDAPQRRYARQAIADMDKAVELAASVDNLDSRLIGAAEFYLRRGQARQWSGETGEADLVEALNRVAPGQEFVRRVAVDLLDRINPAAVHQQLDSLLASSATSADERLWAIRRKSLMLVREDKLPAAERLLADWLDKTPTGPTQDILEIQLARVHYESFLHADSEGGAAQSQPEAATQPADTGRQAASATQPDHDAHASVAARERLLDEAYLRLSAVQIRRTPGMHEEQIDAELYWLIGEVNVLQDRPQEARESFQRVLDQYSQTEFVRASRLGIARAMSAYEPPERALDAYRPIVEDLAGGAAGADDPLVDRKAVRASLLAMGEQLRRQEKWESAFRFLGLAYLLMDPLQSKPSQADVKEMQGQLMHRLATDEKLSAAKLAREANAGRPIESQPESAVRLAERSRHHFLLAAEAFLDAAHLGLADDPRVADDLELAADCYDDAGELMRAIAVLEQFIRDYPRDQSRTARAVFNLARACQGAGQYEQAIAEYKRMLADYENSPDANKSLVPLAQCHKALGQLDQAEGVLTGLLADDQRFSPDSKEYMSALFELARLKYERGQYPVAIARLDEVIQRDPNSPQAGACRYYLADSYRLSGLALDSAIAGAANAAERDRLTRARTRWLSQAREQFDRVVATLEARAADGGELGELDWIYLRNSYFLRADCLFDQGLVKEAIDQYDLAAVKCQGSPEALAAYVQIVTCYQRLGQPEQARAANERAKWLLKRLPADSFARLPMGLSRDYFAQWLDWVGQSGTW